ncbi:hypothetical protein CYD94_03325 [Ralstonia solanacearum]|uniref:hypothetical protein n=1 Tax=Ralstonia pseudosolanacearum TaxID=1310165 RepID=UPI000C9F408F|nr:hypothetical protein [Ralstonia pseudosolanacearum]AUS41346.1 hypothetical protein CYD94_03325 [Ralstonia solanacearum]
MTAQLSPIAAVARLEAATETLAEYIGYLNGEIDVEQDKAEPNAGRIEALVHELEIVLDERRSITPDDTALIDRALYVRAPFLKLLRRA